MKIIGHRGAKGYVAENTIASFLKAFEMGCRGIELDVFESKDGEVLVFHDEHLERLCGVSGSIKALKSNQAQSLMVLGQYPIPTLKEVLETFEQAELINIEMKDPDAVESVAGLLRRAIDQGATTRQFLVSSFDWVALKKFRVIYPEIPIGVLTETDLDLAIAFAQMIQAEAIHPYFHLLNAENRSRMRELGFAIYTWTVNEPEDIQNIKQLAPEGVITDYPDRWLHMMY